MTHDPSAPAAPRRAWLGLTVTEWLTIYAALAVATLPAVMPVMVGVLAEGVGIGVARAGYVVSANMGGIFAGSMLGAWLSRRVGWSALLAGGLVLMIAGNGLTMAWTAFPGLVGTRAISGLGEGVAGSICYLLMGRSATPGRTIAYYSAGQALVGAVGMAVLPTLVQTHGWRAFYVLVSVVALPAVFLAAAAVRGSLAATAAPVDAAEAKTSGRTWAALASVFLYFTGMGVVWAFMERIGAGQGLDLTRLSAALSASSLAILGGTLLVGLVAFRLSIVTATLAGIGLVLASVACLMAPGYAFFFVGICALNFAWGFQYPFLFRNLAEAGQQGNAAVLTPTATGGALMVAPAVGGPLLQHGGVGALGAACLMLTVASLLLVILTRTRWRAAAVLQP